MDSRQLFRAGRPCPVCGGHAGMPRGEAALSSQPAQEALQDVAGHDTPAGVGRVPLETRLLQPPAGLPVGITGETVQALARSEQVRRRLRHIWQMRTRAAHNGAAHGRRPVCSRLVSPCGGHQRARRRFCLHR